MRDFSILITGDFYGGGDRVSSAIDNKLYSQLFGNMIPMIESADLAICNLESPLVKNKSIKGIKKTGPVLKANVNCVDALESVGFHLLTLANNHIMDCGEQGLADTLESIKSSRLTYVGVGNNLNEARTVKFFERAQIKVAIINFCENEWSTTHGNYAGANPLDPLKNFNDIQAAKKEADHVIVIFHGGIEHFAHPSKQMKEQCRFFIDAGASAVVCHHTHVSSGYELYKTKPIFYGIGNFIFDNPRYRYTERYTEWNYGYGVKLVCHKAGDIDFEILPFKQCNEIAGIELLEGDERSLFFDRLQSLNSIIKDDHLLDNELDGFVKKSARVYLAYLQPYTGKYLAGMFKRKYLPSVFSAAKYRLLLNIIRCESHRVVLERILKTNSK